MNGLRNRYLHALGVPVWTLRGESGAESSASSSAETVCAAAAVRTAALLVSDRPAEETTHAGLDWDALAARVAACTLCPLHKGRTQTVFGVGDRAADLMVVGEAPGAEEDRQGEPFVGRAGLLLNAMLQAIGLSRRQVYIANVLKCRPPNNRDPSPQEQATCTPYLEQQIRLLAPRAMLAVGRIAAQWLLQSDRAIGRLRGQVHRYGEAGTPLVVTYHPAYLLRSPLAKAKTWQDLLMVKELIVEKA